MNERINTLKTDNGLVTGRLVRDYPSWLDFVGASQVAVDSPEATDPKLGGQASTRVVRIQANSKFWGTGTYAEALKLAKDGWPEGRAIVEPLRQRVLAAVKGAPRDYRQTGHWTVAGAGVNIGRYLQGRPDCMRGFRATLQAKRGKVITVALHGSATFDWLPVEYHRRGAAVAVLCDALESAGFRVEILVSFSTCNVARSRQRKACQTSVGYADVITLKMPDEPLDLDELYFALCHPDAQRRISFALLEGLSAGMRRVLRVYLPHGSYGAPWTQVPLPADVGDEAIEVAHNDSRFHTEAGVVWWVLEQLENQGVEIDRETT